MTRAGQTMKTPHRLRIPTFSSGLPASLRLGLVAAGPVAIAPAGAALQEEIDDLCRTLVKEHAGKQPSAIDGLAPARELYRAFGIDPTRTRPSSEALLRRILRGKGLPRILNAVDVCNLCALRFLLSIGLYDAGRIRGNVTLRPGAPGETYAGIRKDEVHLEGRPVLADEEGAFGNPTSDSLRTSVTLETTSIDMVIFAPASVPPAALEAHVAAARALMERHLAPAGGAVTTDGTVISGPR